MQQRDRISSLVLEILTSAKKPLETPEVVKLVQNKIPTTRTIVFKRLTDLRGDGDVKGKHLGSGKGVWVWWTPKSFVEKSSLPKVKHDKVIAKINEILDEASSPLETKEVEDLVRDAIPTTRAIVFKRLTNLRGDQALKGKYVGSGKGVWIWWRNNAFKV